MKCKIIKQALAFRSHGASDRSDVPRSRNGDPMVCSKLAEGMKFRSALTKSNDTIALRMTIAFGSIWCVYAFAVFSLVPLLAPSVENALLYISNCIQLIALPALMVGSAILARSSDQRARSDHDALLEILKDVHEELAILKQMMPGVAQEPDTERKEKSRVPNP